MKNIRVFVSENFRFLEVKFSIYLNRRVVVMMALWFYVCGIFPVCRDLFTHPLGVTQIRLYL